MEGITPSGRRGGGSQPKRAGKNPRIVLTLVPEPESVGCKGLGSVTHILYHIHWSTSVRMYIRLRLHLQLFLYTVIVNFA